MFGKKKERKREPFFQENAKHTILPEDDRYNSKQDKPENRGDSAIIASDAEIKGTIRFEGSMVVHGHIHGKISTDKGEITVTESGIVHATITTRTAVLEGRIEGKIIATDKIALKHKAHLIGALMAKSLVVEEGVVFVGQCNVNPAGVKCDNIIKKEQPEIDDNEQKNSGINKANTVLHLPVETN